MVEYTRMVRVPHGSWSLEPCPVFVLYLVGTMRQALHSLLFFSVGASAQLPPHESVGFPAADAGYYLTTTLDFAGNNSQAQAVMFDGAGHVAYRRVAPGASNFHVWPDGRMSLASQGRHLIFDSTFAMVDTVRCANGVSNDLHELRILSDGHYLLLGIENITMDLSDYEVFEHNGTPGSTAAIVRAGVVQELDADGALVWEWHTIDHFDFLDTDTSRLNDPQLVDWSHCNAVERDTDGNVLLSLRHFNQVVKIDRQADTVLWRLGGVRNEFSFVDDPGFFLQHDVRRSPTGSITLFDNSKADAHAARGVEYLLDEQAMTATPLWSRAHDATSYSRAMGSMQRLEDGRSLIGWGALTPENAMFTMYNEAGDPMGELYFPDGYVTYRAQYVEELPFTLHRPEVVCVQQGSQFLLSVEPASDEVLWHNGATSTTVLTTPTDTAWVEVPAAPGTGWLRSKPIVPGVDCSFSAIGTLPGRSITLVTDAVVDRLEVLVEGPTATHVVEVMDMMGRTHSSHRVGKGRSVVDVRALPTGNYVLRVDGSSHRFMKL